MCVVSSLQNKHAALGVTTELARVIGEPPDARVSAEEGVLTEKKV